LLILSLLLQDLIKSYHQKGMAEEGLKCDADPPPTTLVLSGELKFQSRCLGAYTLVAGSSAHGHPVWRHERQVGGAEGRAFGVQWTLLFALVRRKRAVSAPVARGVGGGGRQGWVARRGRPKVRRRPAANHPGAVGRAQAHRGTCAAHVPVPGRLHAVGWVLGARASGVSTRARRQVHSKVHIWQVAVQREDHVGVNGHCYLRLSDTNLLFPHQSRVTVMMMSFFLKQKSGQSYIPQGGFPPYEAV
jgi:hypothetical protein